MRHMKRMNCTALLTVVLCIIFSGLASSEVHDQQLSEDNKQPSLKMFVPRDAMEDRVKKLVVTVKTKYPNDETQGAGIIFGTGPDKLYIVTANHVVRSQGKKAEEITIKLEWMRAESFKAKLLPKHDPALDLAVLSISGLNDMMIPFDGLPFDQLGDPAALLRGDAIYMLGHPIGRLWRINSTAEKFAETRANRLEFESNLIATGHSGGALLNRTMELVGMLVSDTPPYGDAVNISAVLDALTVWSFPVNLSRFGVSVSAGESGTCILTPKGVVQCRGQAKEYDGRALQTGELDFKSISAGGGHVCGITPNGTAYCMGSNNHGQLGDGTESDSYASPTPVRGEHVFASVSAGNGHTCGVTLEGQAYCWGLGTRGQLGNGVNEESSVPVLVSGGLTFRSVSAGWLYTYGVTANGDLYYWGSLNDGYLGYASVPDHTSAGFESVSAAMYHACGIDSKGMAHCWGINDGGQLGNGSARESSQVPTPVSGGLVFRSVSAGLLHTCGIDTEGAAYCWGKNGEGQLGNDTRLSSVVPAPVSGELAFVSISAGFLHTCGVTTDSSVYCWGSNHNSEFGTGKAGSDRPVRVFPAPGLADDISGRIHEAVVANDVALLRTTLNTGADVDVLDDTQQTPLHVAVEAGHYEIVALLMDHGANPNARFPQEESQYLPVDSPLTLALAQAHPDMLRLLLAKGADPNARSPTEGSTALHWAAAKADAESVTAIIESGAEPDILDGYLRTPLHHAVKRGHVDITRQLIKAGADPDAMNYGENTPLHIAASEGHEELVHILVSAGASVNQRDKWNRAPFHRARMKEHYAIADLLAARGVTHDRLENGTATSLFLAAQEGNLTQVQELLQQGADVHEQVTDRSGEAQPRVGGRAPYRGRASLHAAVIGHHNQVVELLLEAGANPNRWDANGYSAFHLAVLSGQYDLAQKLLKRGANVHWPVKHYNPTPLLHDVSRDGALQAATLLLDQGAKVNVENSTGTTALYEACKYGHVDMVILLLSRGADPNAGSYNWSPVGVAVTKPSAEIVKLLLDAGASIDASTNHATPLHLALKRDERLAVATLLLERGASVTIANERGSTALDLVGLPPESGKDGLRRLLAVRSNPAPDAWLGVGTQNLDSALAAELGDASLRGVEVRRIASDGAARQAHMLTGDIIIAYDNQPVRTDGELDLLIGESRPGQQVTLDLLRDGQPLSVLVMLK